MSHIPGSTPDAPDRVRLAAALVLVAVPVSWAIQYPFWPNRDRLLDQGKIVDYSWVAFGLAVVGLAAWLWALWQLLPTFRGRSLRDEWRLVAPVSVVMLASTALMYPANAIDVYIYAVRSRLLTAYGENPNAVQPITHWDTDPYMKFASKEWADNLSPYGPLWNQLAAPVTWVGGDSVAAAIYGFKALSIISALAIAWLVYDLVKHRSPGWALPAALFWLWNPLVQWDGIGNAHNDVTLMLPVVAALWAWQRRRDEWVIPVLVASVLIKYVTLILLPIAIVALWRRNPGMRERVRGIVFTIGGMLGLAVFSLFPFFDLGAVRESALEQGAKVSTSPAWVVVASFREWTVTDVTAESVQRAAYAIVAGIMAAWAVACWRRPEILPRAAFEVMFAFMLIASTNQRPWYVIWLVPLAALLLPDNSWKRTIVWSVTALCGHLCTIWLWYVWDFDAWGYYWYFMIIIGVVFLPVIAVSAWEGITWLRDRSGGARRRALATGQTSPR